MFGGYTTASHIPGLHSTIALTRLLSLDNLKTLPVSIPHPHAFSKSKLQSVTGKDIILSSKFSPQLNHFEAQPAGSAGRLRRSSENLSINVSLNLASLSRADAGGVCYGGTAGLERTSLRLEYRSLAGGDNEMPWTGVEGKDDIPLDSGNLQLSIPANPDESQCVQFRLVQEEHGGGYCNCWSVQDPQVESMGTTTVLT